MISYVILIDKDSDHSLKVYSKHLWSHRLKMKETAGLEPLCYYTVPAVFTV